MRGKSVIAVLFLAVAASPFAVFAQTGNPIHERIVPDGLTVRILDWVQVPDSGDPAEPARISLAYHSRDGSGRLFVNDLRGYLYVIRDGDISLYLDVAASSSFFTSTGGKGIGFHAFSFHPDFATNGKLYTIHSETPDAGVPDFVGFRSAPPFGHSVIVEWTSADPGADVFSGTSREVLRIEQPGHLHHVQEIGFNPNAVPGGADYGILYIAQGDGTELNANPQSLETPHGALLRIDPAGTDGVNGQYGIPPDNPFFGDGDPDTLDEIWAYGFRNPQRFSWDTGGSQKLLLADIGQANVEEINLVVPGGNYGWNEREGTFLFDTNQTNVVYPLPPDDEDFGYMYPVAQYDHDEGSAVLGRSAVIGGFVYRGDRIPSLYGRYVFGDLVNGRIFQVPETDLVQGSQATIHELSFIDAAGDAVTMLDLTQTDRFDLRFGIDEIGEIYVLSKADGKVRRLVSAVLPDSDSDGEPDVSDNCDDVPNPDQRDADGDGLGNACDTDDDNDGVSDDDEVANNTDPFDPDTDDDGIGDALDADPLNADNFAPCMGAEDYVFSESVVGILTCAANASITVVAPAEVLGTGSLRLIAPVLIFEPPFIVTGSMDAVSADPCPGCAP